MAGYDFSEIVEKMQEMPAPAGAVVYEPSVAELENLDVSRKMGVSSLMGRCKGQDGASVLTMQDGTALGCAVCYESIYGEYCTGYVNAGAEAVLKNSVVLAPKSISAPG